MNSFTLKERMITGYGSTKDPIASKRDLISFALPEEETIGEYAENKTGEEGIFPVALNKSKVEYGSQNTHKRCQH